MHIYGKKSPIEQLSGTVSDLDCFLHRSLDTGFKTKWSGLWIPPYKYLDYYGLKINGVWLNREKLVKVEYSDELSYHYSLDGIGVKETVRTLEDSVGIKCIIEIENKTGGPKAVKTTMEAGVDIREKSEDIGPSEYRVEETEDGFEVSRNDRALRFEGGELEGEGFVKNHQPGERQRCYVPGDLVSKTEIEEYSSEKISFRMSADVSNHGELNEKDPEAPEMFEDVFEQCLDSVENLVYERNGKGIIAGHPWFQSYWARDTFWTVLGLIDAGRYELSEDILENFAERDLAGKIPLEGSENGFSREDTYPLFIIAAEKLKQDHEANSKIEDACENAMKQLEIEENVVRHDPEGTWMDTLQISSSVDIQSLWLEAARLRDDDRQEKLEKGLEKFYEDDIIKGSLEEDSARSVNFAIPLMFGHVDEDKAEKYLATLNAEFTSKYGARTRSAMDPGYDSSGYHTGSVWGLTTCWVAGANARYGNYKQAVNQLERFSKFLDQDQPGALPEVVDAETGELLGCMEQAWSAGLMLHIIKSYLADEEAPS